MPELPEVETVARQLEPLLRGQQVRRLEILDQKLNHLDGGLLRGLTVISTRRVGKQVVIALAHEREMAPHLWLTVHLRMTGRLFWQVAAGARHAHLRARLLLSQGELQFVDVRRFGTLRLCQSEAELSPCGLDPLSRQLTTARLQRLLAGSSQAIKPWLLRQDRLVGIGNIYACEALNEAGIDPWRPAGDLSLPELGRLRQALRRTLRRAIACCGTTFSDFQDTRGSMGSYQRYLRVYSREGEFCPCGGGAVLRVVQQGRSTFYCRCCQLPQGQLDRPREVVNRC